MTIDEVLKTSGIDRLDAELLLAHVVGKTREWLVSHDSKLLTTQQLSNFLTFVERRKRHEPIAYIIGEKEFYGRTFRVTPDVLIPRPATEGLIDIALQFLQDGKPVTKEIDTGIVAEAIAFGNVTGVKTVIDIGCGSGCIAITLKMERPDLTVVATDISHRACLITAENAKRHHADILTRNGDLLEPVKDLKDTFIVVSNPPYISEGEKLMLDVSDFEPRKALYGGPKGDETVVKIYNRCKEYPLCRGLVMERKTEQSLVQ